MRFRPAISSMMGTSFHLSHTVWIALAAATAVHALASPSSHTVFPLFAASANHWWTDQALYASYPSLDRFRYPPTFAVAMTPFAMLGLQIGGIAWSWCSLAVYGVGLWRFARDVLPQRWRGARRASFLALGAIVAFPGIWNAQSNTLVVGLLLVATSSLARQCWWTAAVLLAAAVWTKLTPLVPALLLCSLQPARLAPRFVVAMALGSMIPFLTRPPDIVFSQYVDWVNHLVNTGSARWPGFRDGWTLWLALTNPLQTHGEHLPFFTPVDSAGYRALQLATGLGTLAWSLWQQSRDIGPRQLFSVTLGMGMVWLMLFGPAVEHATYAFLAPFLTWAVLQRQASPRGRGLSLVAFVLIAILGWDFQLRRLLGNWPLLAAPLPLGSVVFTLWLIDYARSCPGGVPRRVSRVSACPQEREDEPALSGFQWVFWSRRRRSLARTHV
jgi:hypothetical protein